MTKVVRGICVAAVLCVGAVLAAAAVAGTRGERAEEPASEEPAPVEAVGTDADLHLLLLGCDRAASLTDSMLLVSVSPASGDVRVLQLPRDTYAAYTERDYKKLNGAYNTLGADGIRQWLVSALGVRIDYTAVYDLDCVRRAVDAVGGVELEIPSAMRYSDPVQGLEIDLPAGRHRLNGAQAEQFIRFRAGYADADLGRLDAQKLFLSAFLHTCRSLSAPELVRVCMTVLPEVKTDLPTGAALRLALSLLRAEAPVMTAETAPGEAAKGVSGAWYYILCRAEMTRALSRWSGEAAVSFDPDRLFDRPGNPEFHRIYTAPAAVPSGGIEYGRNQNGSAPDAGRCLSGGIGARNF